MWKIETVSFVTKEVVPYTDKQINCEEDMLDAACKTLINATMGDHVTLEAHKNGECSGNEFQFKLCWSPDSKADRAWRKYKDVIDVRAWPSRPPGVVPHCLVHVVLGCLASLPLA